MKNKLNSNQGGYHEFVERDVLISDIDVEQLNVLEIQYMLVR